jgi:two-component system LytT family sensor kinase
MRRVAGLARQAAAEQWRAWARMLFMEHRHPPRFPSFWQLQMMGWISFYLVGFVGSIPEIFRRPGALRANNVAYAFMFLGSCAIHPFCRSLLHRSASWLAFAWRAAAWCMVWGAAVAFATTLTLVGFRKIDWSSLAGRSVQFAFVLFLWCSVYLSIKQWQQSAQERERALRAETEAREARLSALRYQLNPHFLFNSLNAVSTLVLDGNAPAATRMLAQIGEFLRTTLDHEIVSEVPLSQEIAFTEQYLAIEQTRLGERLKVDLTISPQTLDALVPSMFLQPLVENAVRHGIAPLIEGGTIAIRSKLQDGRLCIIVKNSGAIAMPEGRPGNGIGLSNTAERLNTLYGTNHKFLLEWLDEGGCEVTVELPFRRIAHSQEASLCAL